jgi:CheY-like chemotaxis protein
MLMSKPFILIAEDDLDDRFLLQTAFVENGHQDTIEFVENGIELISYLSALQNTQRAHENFPYLILLDLNMPKRDGREVLKEIKQHPIFKNIPVVVFTTTKNSMEIKRCYELGANSYVVKPVSFDDLLKVLKDIRTYWFTTVALPY